MRSPVDHGTHLAKFACLDCRSVFKRPVSGTAKQAPRPIEVRVCPNCGRSAYLMGGDFKAPPKRDDDGWALVSRLVRSGLPFFQLWEPIPASETDPVYAGLAGRKGVVRVVRYPTTLKEADAFVRAHADKAMPFVTGASTDGKSDG
jgi:NAD-dependent SIR2 family protein deacetylase